MTNPTRQEIIDAHTALENLSDLAFIGADSVNKEALANIWKDEIKRVVPPKPRPTMADVEWDNDKHYLAEAESEAYGLVIMLQKSKETGNILIIFRGELKDYLIWQKPNFLAPTGKRYALTEVHE